METATMTEFPAAPRNAAPGKYLTVLVCSCNVGNKEPTAASFAEWIPDDGDVMRSLHDTLYPLDTRSEADSPSGDFLRNMEDGQHTSYDIIAIGMQEAAFVSSDDKNRERPNAHALKGLGRSESYSQHDSQEHNGKRKSKTSTDKTSATIAKNYDTRILGELISNRCPSYEIISSSTRGEMRLFILVRAELANEVLGVNVKAENTGIGSILANKGGIVACMNIRKTRLAFMTCHLEAHEGNAHYQNRNRDLSDIFSGANAGPKHSNMLDTSVVSHHMFLCGDLNYRINFPKEVNGIPHKLRRSSSIKMNGKGSESVKDLENGKHFKTAKSLIEEEKWDELNAGDELAKALKEKACLVGFKTLPCNFPPTFKVKRGGGYQYNEKRTPSYTDRILWKSTEDLTHSVIPFFYEPCPKFITSDHKPVRGGFAVKTNVGPGLNPKEVVELKVNQHHERSLHLLFSNISCAGLPVMDSVVIGGLTDPYVTFLSTPKELLWDRAWPSTKVIYRNLNPVWDEEIHLVLDFSHESSSKSITERAAGATLYLTVMDYDHTSGDDTIGAVEINIESLIGNLQRGRFSDKTQNLIQNTDIERPILHCGKERGILKCSIGAAYLTKKEVKDSFAKQRKLTRSQLKNSLGCAGCAIS